MRGGLANGRQPTSLKNVAKCVLREPGSLPTEAYIGCVVPEPLGLASNWRRRGPAQDIGRGGTGGPVS